MIINGGSRSNGAFFAKHLVDAEHNEHNALIELRNLAADNIPDALREIAAVAMGTFCKNYFYHANINPRHDEQLTEQQWSVAVDTLERSLMLTGNARFVVEHTKHGRTHRHVIWSRINVARMRAVVMTDDYEKQQLAARELEKAFGLEEVSSVAGRTRASGPRPARRPKAWESFRGKKSGIDPTDMKEQLTQLYRECTTAAHFLARLAEQRWQLVRGHRAWCIRDEAGQLHSLARRLEGVTALERAKFLQSLSATSVPGPNDSEIS